MKFRVTKLSKDIYFDVFSTGLVDLSDFKNLEKEVNESFKRDIDSVKDIYGHAANEIIKNTEIKRAILIGHIIKERFPLLAQVFSTCV